MARNLRQVHDLTLTRVGYANPQLSRTSRTSTCTHRQLSACSWAVKKNKSGVSLPGSRPWSDFFGIFFPFNPLRATSFLSVCGDCLRRSPGVTQVLPTLSLSLSHTHSPSSKSDPGRLYVSFSLVCLEKSQGIERLCRIQARTTALLNQQQSATEREKYEKTKKCLLLIEFNVLLFSWRLSIKSRGKIDDFTFRSIVKPARTGHNGAFRKLRNGACVLTKAMPRQLVVVPNQCVGRCSSDIVYKFTPIHRVDMFAVSTGEKEPRPSLLVLLSAPVRMGLQCSELNSLAVTGICWIPLFSLLLYPLNFLFVCHSIHWIPSFSLFIARCCLKGSPYLYQVSADHESREAVVVPNQFVGRCASGIVCKFIPMHWVDMLGSGPARRKSFLEVATTWCGNSTYCHLSGFVCCCIHWIPLFCLLLYPLKFLVFSFTLSIEFPCLSLPVSIDFPGFVCFF